MEMKQKEQEINKRKKRLLWKEKRMKETVLNAMNPVEREIFEKELQKVHLKKSTALNDIGKTVWIRKRSGNSWIRTQNWKKSRDSLMKTTETRPV